MVRSGWLLVLLGCWCASPAWGQSRADEELAEYFRLETARLEDACLAEIATLDDWMSRRDEYRRQLLEMLGLDPLPERTDLKATVTGRVERDDFVVENLHFQSRPQLYVTGNLYLPKKIEGRVPAILYVCGHGGVKKDGISYGNKVHYQHHGAWFARNGYVCLTIDSLQLGEIEGIHHGTHRYDLWWWLNRGYTPAGVEAWNCLRALDYLQSRPEVDGARLGVTGRSGGGAYSWWIAAIDERIQAAVPVAGITDLQNHVVDGCVEGHCDCMFMVNTYQWDYPQVAALVAPRPLLISNSDRDGIFPLEGVVRTHRATRKIYQLHKVPDRIALQITAGPHQDTQELRVHAFRWFQQYLKKETDQIDSRTTAYFTPDELRVFAEGLPADQMNTRIAKSFVPAVRPLEPPQDARQWTAWRESWRQALRDKVFRGWPDTSPLDSPRLVASHVHGNVVVDHYEWTSQSSVSLPLYVLRSREPGAHAKVRLHVAGQQDWEEISQAAETPVAQRLAERYGSSEVQDGRLVCVIASPRGIGPTAWNPDKKKQVQNQRRFYLLGQSLDGQRVWDVVQSVRAVRQVPGLAGAPIELTARGPQAALAVYASLFAEPVARLELRELPENHDNGPYLLNIDRVLTLPAAVALAAERAPVELIHANPAAWSPVLLTAERLQWPAQRIRVQPE